MNDKKPVEDHFFSQILQEDPPENIHDIFNDIKAKPVYFGPGEWYRLLKRLYKKKH